MDYEQSPSPLRDSRAKRTRERARKSPASTKVACHVEKRASCFHAVGVFRARSRVLFSRLSLSEREPRETARSVDIIRNLNVLTEPQESVFVRIQ